MINRKFVAIVLAMGLLLSIGCVADQDKFAEEPAAKELAYKDQTGLVIPGPEDVRVTPMDQGKLEPAVVVPSEIQGHGISLWIQGSTGWTQYAVVPQSSTLSLVAYTPLPNAYTPNDTTIPGELLEMYPSTPSSQGIYQKTYYNFNPGHNQISFSGDVAGTYYLLLTTNDPSSNRVLQWSNAVIIEVV